MQKLKSLLALSAFAMAAPAYAAPADTLAANRAAMGGDAWNGKATLTAVFAVSGQGMSGTSTSVDDLGQGYWKDNYALGPLTGANGYDGTHAWAKDQSGTVTLQDGGDQRTVAVNDGYRRANLWWRDDRGGAAIVDDGEKSDKGATYDVLTVTPQGGKTFDAWFDAKTHLLSRVVEVQGFQTITTTYSDYAPTSGAEIARKTVTNNGDAKYDLAATLTQAAFGPALPRSDYSAPKVTVKDFSIAGGATQTTFPFTLINNHIYADVSVNGKGPYSFIFDTGGLNVVTPTLGKSLGLASQGDIQGNGAGSGHMDFSVTKVSSLSMGAATIKDQTFIEAPLDSMADVEGIAMPGMVGFETFRRFVTRIDYGTNRITLIRPDAFDPKDAGTPVPFEFDGNQIAVKGAYNGIPGSFTVDTGARDSLTLTTPFAKAHGLAAGGVDAVTGWGVGGPTRAVVVHGETLAIGPCIIDKPITEISTDKAGADTEASLAGNIGAGILKRYVVTLDYEHQRIYLKPVSVPVTDLDTFDRSGMWINRSPDGYAVVDVTKGGPADQAGLKAGDIIVAVDGKPATATPVYAMRQRLRDDAPGTTIAVTVKRGGETKTLRVTLRDLI